MVLLDCWFQSAPASQVIVFPVPTATSSPIAPLRLVAGTVKVAPPSLETSREIVTVGVSAETS